MQPTQKALLLCALSTALCGCAGLQRARSTTNGQATSQNGQATSYARPPWRLPRSERSDEHASRSEMRSTSQILDYDGAARLALMHNPSLREARAARGIARAQIIQARVLPNPRLGTALDIPTDGATAGTNVGYGAAISWQINPLFALRTAVDAARHEARAVELGIAWSEWQVVEEARLGVIRSSLVTRRLALAQGIADQWQSQRRLLELGMETQDVTALEVQAARSMAEDASLAVLALVREQRLSRLQWLEALGLDPESDARVADEPHLPEDQALPPLTDLIQRLPSKRLDLLGLRQAIEAEDARARAAAINAFPAVELSFGRTLDTANLGSLGVGLAIELPFFDRNQGAIELTRATREQLRQLYFTRLQRARFEVARALSELSSVGEQLALVRASVPHLAQLVTGAQQLVHSQNLTVVDVYELRRAWLMRRLLEEQLVQKELELRVGLELASGGPWAAGTGS